MGVACDEVWTVHADDSQLHQTGRRTVYVFTHPNNMP
jgi:hypothetical protein